MKAVRFAILIAFNLTLTCVTHAQTCDTLFTAEGFVPFIHESWRAPLERDYQDMLKTFGATPDATVEPGMGHLLYQHWKQNPDVGTQLFKLGFKLSEPVASGKPVESPAADSKDSGVSGRFLFPATYQEIVDGIQSAQGSEPVFKLAAYNSKSWFKMEEKSVDSQLAPPTTDMSFPLFAKAVSEGYFPLWPSGRTMSFMHDLVGHVTEFVEYPQIFPALQKFFVRYVREDWQKIPYYQQRSNIFGEFSYILRPERYDIVESYIVSSGIRFGSLTLHARQIRKAMKKDLPTVLEKVKKLTDAFDVLFMRHGGGARDFFTVDSAVLTKEAIEAYVQATKTAPQQGTYKTAVIKDSSIEGLESLEGIKRQIQYVADLLTRSPSEELKNYLALRVAQLEIAILQQRKLELTQVDIIQDSMLPMGVDSKTRRYFKSFQMPGSRHYEVFVGK